MIAEVPFGWTRRTIKELAQAATGAVQTGPFGAQLHAADYVDDGIPLILIRNMIEGGLNRTGMPMVHANDAKRLHRYSLQPGDVIFSRVGRVGSCFLATEDQAGWLISGQLLRVRLPFTTIDHRYLYRALTSKYAQDQINGASVGTTRTSINTTILESLPLLVPTARAEQVKISDILSVLDNSIARVKALIAKQIRIRTGLMQDLLTRGIDPNGALRSAQTHEFKDSSVGRIPVEWDVFHLESLAIRGSGHTPNKKKPGYWNGGIKWVSLADSAQLDNLWIKETDKEISVLGIKNSSAVLHPKGTVILSRDAGVGKSAILASDMAVSQHFIAWRCKPDKLNNVYLYYWLQKDKPRFEGIASGSTIVTIGLQFFREYCIACPRDVKEQERIATVLTRTHEALEESRTVLRKLASLRVALMHDLLTGRKRVTPLIELVGELCEQVS